MPFIHRRGTSILNLEYYFCNHLVKQDNESLYPLSY